MIGGTTEEARTGKDPGGSQEAGSTAVWLDEDWERRHEERYIIAKDLLDRKGQGKSMPALVRILMTEMGLGARDSSVIAKKWMRYEL